MRKEVISNFLDISWNFSMFWWDDYIYKKIENLDKYGFFEGLEYEGQETVGSRLVINKEEKADGLNKNYKEDRKQRTRCTAVRFTNNVKRIYKDVLLSGSQWGFWVEKDGY